MSETCWKINPFLLNLTYERVLIPVSSYEDQQVQKRVATQKRVRNLLIIVSLAVAMRMAVKDPPPVKQVDRSKAQYVYVAGQLDNLTVEQQKALTPEQLAKFKEADRKVVEEKERKLREELGVYEPLDAPVENTEDIREAKQQKFVYEKRKRAAEWRKREIELQKEITKKKIVELRNGRYVFAENASLNRSNLEIRVGPSMRAQLPARLAKKISDNHPHWKEPVPRGFIKLKPAPGMTIVVANKIKNRISIQKRNLWDDEIF